MNWRVFVRGIRRAASPVRNFQLERRSTAHRASHDTGFAWNFIYSCPNQLKVFFESRILCFFFPLVHLAPTPVCNGGGAYLRASSDFLRVIFVLEDTTVLLTSCPDLG